VVNDGREFSLGRKSGVEYPSFVGFQGQSAGFSTPTDFAGDVLDELLWFDESFFLPEAVTFPWSAAFTCRCWN